MVNSILNANINYPELKKLDPDDKNYDATLYEISIMNVDIIIALGQPKYTFINDNIIFYPIYLVKDDKVNTQIGVYEIFANQLPNLVDEDGDIELDKINLPLTYQFVTIDLLKSAENKLAISHDKQNGDNVLSDEEDLNEELDEDLDSDDVKQSKDPSDKFAEDDVLPEQTEAQSNQESDDYVHDKNAPWIQHFLNSNEYNIIDNEGGGDCLFAVIRDALKAVDKEMSVMDLRKKLSSEATNELFENYKNHYNMYVTSAQDTEIQLKDLSRSINELKDRLRNSKDRNEQEKIVEHAKEAANKYKTLKAENNITKELMGEFRFMKKVKTLDDFKKIITTCEFWADTWAISTLERILNIKLVIFSSESWNQGDKSNVIQCGQLNDQLLESDAKFEPQYYILLDYTGTHYKLITYKHHRIFNFVEIPYRIKLLITNKCLEKLAGPYNLIPQFRVFNEQLGIEQPIELDIEVIKEKENGLYTDDIVFQYYIKSNNKPLPGKGIGEKIPADMVKTFSALSQIPEWRRKLDNEYESPFELDGHKWKTVEHYYQAAKFKNTNKEFYLLFSLDSGSKISTDIELATSAGSKTGKHKGDLLRSKDIKIDPDFFGGNDDLALEKALFAKFSQNNDMKQLLINTQNAKLLHYRKGTEADISNLLMMVRNKISQ